MDTSLESGSVDAGGATGAVARPILGIVAIVVALIVLAVAAVVVAAPAPVVYAPDSPEAAFQRFLTASDEDDVEAAWALLSRSAQAEMPLSRYRRVWRDHSWQMNQDRRIVLGEADVTAERARLGYRVEYYSGGGLFGSGRYSMDGSVNLVREDGGWRIDEPRVGLESVAYY